MIKQPALTGVRLALLILLLIALFLPASSIYGAAPVIVTDVATNITESSVSLNAQITDLGTFAGPNVYLFFQYATDAYYDAHFSAYDKSTNEITWPIASGLTTYSADLSSLTKATEYHFRAVLRYGTAYVYGLDQTFVTTMVYPDRTPEILSLQAYKDLLETGDCVFTILADIPYHEIPAVPVSRAYTWSLIDTGNEVGWNVGYAMNDNGYNLNLYSLYFPASVGITWGNNSKYSVRLSGNAANFSGVIPPVYDSTDSADYAVTADTWTSATYYKVKLATDMVKLAQTLEQDWQVVLLDEQDTKTVLSSNGEKLFRNAIPGIQSMAPNLFYIKQGDTDVSKRTWGTSLDDLYKGTLLGPDGQPGGGDDSWIGASIIPLADWMNIPLGLLIALACLGCCVLVIYKANQKYGNAMPGYVASLIIIICFSMLAMGMIVGALVGMAIVIIAGWILFMRKA